MGSAIIDKCQQFKESQLSGKCQGYRKNVSQGGIQTQAMSLWQLLLLTISHYK